MTKKNEIIAFHLRDIVTWNIRRYPHMVESMKEKYGEGPFRVVGVRLHSDEVTKSVPGSHPEAVTIEIKSGERHEFDGHWFLKHEGDSLCEQCGAPALWTRKTQGGGVHFFCDADARNEDDFGQEIPNEIYWLKMG